MLLRGAFIFLVIAIIAALFGFGGIAAAATDMARLLFYIFVAFFVLLLLAAFLFRK